MTALVIDNSNLSLNQGTIGGYRVEDFRESQQQHFRGLLDLVELQLYMPSNPTGPSWEDVANSFSIDGIAKHRDLTSIRALLYFAGHLPPANGLMLHDDYPEAYFYDWGEEIGNSKYQADVRVWNEIRAAWYCCLNIFHPNDKPGMVMEKFQTREPRRISFSEMLARPPVMMKFPRLLYDGKRFQGTESESYNEETYRDGDDKDMVALQGGMENLETEV